MMLYAIISILPDVASSHPREPDGFTIDHEVLMYRSSLRSPGAGAIHKVVNVAREIPPGGAMLSTVAFLEALR